VYRCNEDVRGGPHSRCKELLLPWRSLPPSLKGLGQHSTPRPVIKVRCPESTNTPGATCSDSERWVSTAARSPDNCGVVPGIQKYAEESEGISKPWKVRKSSTRADHFSKVHSKLLKLRVRKSDHRTPQFENRPLGPTIFPKVHLNS
jgi:hypothetical protein